jgi:hypothetical protein
VVEAVLHTEAVVGQEDIEHLLELQAVERLPKQRCH